MLFISLCHVTACFAPLAASAPRNDNFAIWLRRTPLRSGSLSHKLIQSRVLIRTELVHHVVNSLENIFGIWIGEIVAIIAIGWTVIV